MKQAIGIFPIVIATIVALAAAATAQASYYNDVITQPSLLDYWRLDESTGATTAADSKGSLTGNYTNPGGITFGQTGALAGDPDTAVNLSGTSYVDVPNGPTLNGTYSSSGAGLTALTLAAWVNPSTLTGLEAIVGRWGGSSGAGGDQFLLYTFNSGIGITVSSSAGSENGIQAGTLATNQYSFVVGTWNSTGAYQLFINGSKIATGTQTLPGLEASTRPLEIGAQNNNSGRYFQGKIDEPAIFSSVLSDAQILNLYNDGITAVPEPSALVLLSLGAIGLVVMARRLRPGRTTACAPLGRT